MEMIEQTLQSLTKLEVLLLLINFVLIYAYWSKCNFIDSLHFRVNDLQVMNNRLYTLYMQDTNTALHIIEKWQKTLEDNKALVEQIHSNKNQDKL
jgi:hypothetical protein